ncbi:MAG: 50S ribosomal protein L11 methyltransferase [Microthrixaceae bacterium]
MSDSHSAASPGEDLVVIAVACEARDAELVADVLWQAGTTAVSEQPTGVSHGIAGRVADGSARTGRVELTAQVPRRELPRIEAWCEQAAALRADDVDPDVDPDVGAPSVSVIDVDSAWADAWAEHARAYRVGPLVVRPVWVHEPLAPGEIDLALDPGPTFGSGSHQSTRGVLAALVGAIAGGERVLDVGSGSGVLGVAALVLGAAGVVAVDVDPAAGPAGRAAAELVGVAGRWEFHEGSVEVAGGGFDMVLANMLIGAVESVGIGLRGCCAPGATIILGGFLTSQRDRALAAVQPAVVVSESVEDDWVTLVARAT